PGSRTASSSIASGLFAVAALPPEPGSWRVFRRWLRSGLLLRAHALLVRPLPRLSIRPSYCRGPAIPLGQHALGRSMGTVLGEIGSRCREFGTEPGVAAEHRREHLVELEECGGVCERASGERCGLLTV